MPGLDHAGPLPPSCALPLDPDVPLAPEEPPDPDVPLAPAEPPDPDVPLAPSLAPLAPEEPPLAGAGSVGDTDVPGASKRSLELAPLQASGEETRARPPKTSIHPTERDFMATEVYRPKPGCPTSAAHLGDSFPSPSSPTRRS